MNRVPTSFLFMLAFATGWDISAPAWAYIDPGTGSMILQALLGGIAAALIVARLYWYKIKTFFKRGDSGTATKDAADK